MRRRSFLLAASAIALTAMAVRRPSADIQVLTHDAADRSPHRVSAAIDLGVAAVTILITWTSKRLIDG